MPSGSTRLPRWARERRTPLYAAQVDSDIVRHLLPGENRRTWAEASKWFRSGQAVARTPALARARAERLANTVRPWAMGGAA